MLEKILPKQINNKFTGNKIALYVFVVITFITIVRSCIHIFAPDGGAQSIAGFPLNTYSVEASKMVILIFSLWGASQLLMGIVYVVVLLRYKSLVTFMYVLLFTEYLSRFLLGLFKPALSAHVVPGGVLDYVMIPLSLFMLAICIKSSRVN